MQMYKHSRKILDVALFSLKTIIIKCVFTGESIVLKPHPEDPKWMEVYMPLPSCEKDKTFSMARFSTIKIAICFLQHQCL
jgi:hypothetical protein